jgi:hypothetical protein
MIKLKLIPLFFLSFAIFGQSKKNDTIRLFYLGGQSNMDGYGYNKDLPKNLATEFKDVYIFHGNPVPDEEKNGGEGIWQKLKPGHGLNFSSTNKENKLSDRFGIELSLARKLKELYPNDKIAIIKYSRKGTSLDSIIAREFGSWEPDFKGKTGVNQYDYFLKTVHNALLESDIDGNGMVDTIIPSGIFWMQGESDALEEDIAYRYYDHLKRLMDLIRAAFRKDDIPIIIGKISDSWDHKDGKVWPYGDIVQYAQEKFVKKDKKAAIVRSTRYYKYSDPYHYDSNGYIDLGEKFAEAFYKLTF